MCRMSYYFLNVKRKCKHGMDVTPSLAINRNFIYNIPICLHELRLQDPQHLALQVISKSNFGNFS